jgi:thiol-disulfide isomerase/thioredoxin
MLFSDSDFAMFSRHVTRLHLIPMAICAIFLSSLSQFSRGADSTPAAAHRTSAQIIAELEAADKELPKYPESVQFKLDARRQMSREMGSPVQHLVDLINELDKVDHARASGYACRSLKWHSLVRLAFWEYGDASKSLADSSKSAVAAEALFGNVGLMALRWFGSDDDAVQKDLVAQFATLAKANPNDDLLVGAALTMARYHATSDDIANSLRDIVEHDLTSPAAEKYIHQAYKIGRPFKITIKGLDGKSVSTADWKGKVVLVDFWATWCPPCVAEAPKLIEIYQNGHPKGLEILGISHDTSLPALKEFLASHKEMAWPESFNPAGKNPWNVISPSLGVGGIPNKFFIDRNGILRDIQFGHLDEKLVAQLLDEQPKPDPAPNATATSGTSPQPRAPAPAAVDPNNKQADAMLALANSYITAKLPDRAIEKLSLLIQKYPNSTAAQKAKELLAQLNKP